MAWITVRRDPHYWLYLLTMEKAIHGKYVEETYCNNCREAKLCVQLIVSQCVAKIYICADCLMELVTPLKHPDASKPLE